MTLIGVHPRLPISCLLFWAQLRSFEFQMVVVTTQLDNQQEEHRVTTEAEAQKFQSEITILQEVNENVSLSWGTPPPSPQIPSHPHPQPGAPNP